MKLEEAHQLETDLRQEIKKKNPHNSILKQCFSSTWRAIDAYYTELYGYKFFNEDN